MSRNTGGYNEGDPIVFKGNIVNASPNTVAVRGTDHVLYLKGAKDARILSNYFRGFQGNYVKFSGARNSVIAYNNFDGPGVSTYIEMCENNRNGVTKGRHLINLTYFENRLGPDADEEYQTRFYTWNYCDEEVTPDNDDDVGREQNIQYAWNRKYGSQEVGIHLKRNDSDGSAHRIFRTNFTGAGTDSMALGGEAVFQLEEEEFDSQDLDEKLAEYDGLDVPEPQLPQR